MGKIAMPIKKKIFKVIFLGAQAVAFLLGNKANLIAITLTLMAITVSLMGNKSDLLPNKM